MVKQGSALGVNGTIVCNFLIEGLRKRVECFEGKRNWIKKQEQYL